MTRTRTIGFMVPMHAQERMEAFTNRRSRFFHAPPLPAGRFSFDTRIVSADETREVPAHRLCSAQ